MAIINWTLGDYSQGTTTGTLIRIDGNVGYFALDTGDLAVVKFIDNTLRAAIIGERVGVRRHDGRVNRVTPVDCSYEKYARGMEEYAAVDNTAARMANIYLDELANASVPYAFRLGREYEQASIEHTRANNSWRTTPVAIKTAVTSMFTDANELLKPLDPRPTITWSFTEGTEEYLPGKTPLLTWSTYGVYSVARYRGLCKMLHTVGLTPIYLTVSGDGIRGTAFHLDYGLVTLQSPDAQVVVLTDRYDKLLAIHTANEWLVNTIHWEGSGYGFI